jgi:hypothetical protein
MPSSTTDESDCSPDCLPTIVEDGGVKCSLGANSEAPVEEDPLERWRRIHKMRAEKYKNGDFSPIYTPTEEEVASWPKSLDESVARLVSIMDDDFKKEVAAKNKEDLWEYHSFWGARICNEQGLWKGNAELLKSACGGSLCHPDKASRIIIEAVWADLQKEKTVE